MGADGSVGGVYGGGSGSGDGSVSVCVRVCMYAHVLSHACAHTCTWECVCTWMWRPEIDDRCLSSLLSTLLFETGSFSEPGAR